MRVSSRGSSQRVVCERKSFMSWASTILINLKKNEHGVC